MKLTLTLLSAVLLLAANDSTRAADRPNIILMIASDLRQSKNLALEEPDRVRAMHARFLELAGPAAGGRTEGRTQIKEE